MKKFDLFITVSLSLTAFLAGYVIVHKNAPNNTLTQTGNLLDKFGENTDPTPPPIEDTKPFLLSNRKVVSPTNSLTTGDIMFYEKNTGKIFEVNIKSKTEKTLSDKILPNFLSADWSPDRKSSLLSFVSGEGMRFSYFNLNTLEEKELDSKVRSITPSHSGGLVAFYYLENTASDTGKIALAEPDGSYPKKILDTRLKDIKLNWPLPDVISLKTKYGEMFLLTQEGKLTKLTDIKPGLQEKWSPSGKKLLFSTLEAGEYEPGSMLWIKDIDSKAEIPLNLEGRGSACDWSIDDIHVFCAIKKSPSVDEIYKINSQTGVSELAAEPDMPIQDLFLMSLEEYLIFTDLRDNKLYGIKITE